MQDPTYILYDALKERFPFTMDPLDQGLTESLEEIQEKIKAFPKEYGDITWELKDRMETLTSLKAHHAFTLGLDYGLSLMEKLRPYPDTVM